MRDVSLTRKRDENEPRSAERLGQTTHARPSGYLLWAHAETPDEASAAAALVRELERTRGEAFHLLITTQQNAPLVPAVAAAAIHQLVPGETAGSVQRFLDHWRPDVGVVFGIPDRPNLIHAARDTGIPLYLTAHARGTLVGRRRLSYVAASLLNQFDACLAASAADADVLHRHLDDGVSVEVTGPLTDTTFARRCSESEREQTAKILKGRPVWLAANITETEVEPMEEAHRRAFRFAHRLLLVIVPRDLSSAGVMADKLEALGWSVARGSKSPTPAENVQVFIADTQDPLGLWYRLAPISFVGGTLDPDAVPSDPYDPAALGSAVLHGPNTGGAPHRFDRLGKAQASQMVKDTAALASAVQTLLAPDKAAAMAQAGWQVTTESAHVIERLAERINAELDERETV